MTSITLFGIYHKLIIRPPLLNLTRLKYHKKYIWQFRKHNQGKGKMNISEDKWFDLHKQIFVRLRLSLLPEQHFPFLLLSLSHIVHKHSSCTFHSKVLPQLVRGVFFQQQPVMLWDSEEMTLCIHPEVARPVQVPWPSGSSHTCCPSTPTFQRKLCFSFTLSQSPKIQKLPLK